MITKLVLFLCLFCPVPDKERAILEDALSRCSSLERIGEIMDIKLPTVKTHVSHILEKLGVSRRSEARTVAQKRWLV